MGPMMGPLLVTIVLLATHVTCSLTAPCNLSSPLNSTKASELLRNYTEQIQNNAGGNIHATVLQLVEFALNTTGDNALTKSKLNWEDNCFDLFKFTLRQVALINGKELDKFPGNASMDDVRALLTSNATKAVVQDVNKILNTLRGRNVSLDRNLDVFIQDVGFIVKKSSFISIMSYALNSSDHKSTVALLGYDQRLVNATLVDIAEHLFLTPKELQMNLTLEYVVQYLRSAHTFLQKLQDYLKEQREKKWAEKTVMDLVSTEYINILTALKVIYQGNNLTFIQFFWEQKVELSYFDYTVAELVISTSIQSAVIKNYTIEQLFEFLYNNAELNLVYKEGIKASKRMRERILLHYKIASVSILLKTSNVTLSQLARLTDIEFENYAIKYYIHRYAKEHLNTTFNEVETFAKLEPGSLKNATVQDFAQLMAKIGVAYAVKALNESGFLKYLLNNHSALEIHMKPLRLQIEKDRQPLTLNNRVLFHEFQINYLIYLNRLDTVVFYERSVFNFTETIKLNWHSFLTLFELNDQDRQVLKGLFMRYSFEDLSRFFGIKKYTIFSWKFSVIITRLLYLHNYEINECKYGNHSCGRQSRCENYIGGYTCICPPGLNVDPDNYCRDMNECKLVEPKNGGCSNHSHCVNTYGSSLCVCDEGYRKNPAGECKDVNECASIFNRCFPQALCDNLPGSYRCICNPGFEFFDRFNYCKDINECVKGNPCSNVTHSFCVNKRGSYDCRCMKGFYATYNETASPRVLLNCTDINECSRSELNKCHKDADCNNNIGGYNCTCKKGYVGNGYACKENRVINPLLLRLIFIRRTVRLRPFLGFYYGGKSHSKIYISTNGLISIGKRYRRSSPRPCKRVKKDIIAPFWASATGGQVGYQQFAKEDENSAPVLKRINEIVDETTNLAGFETNWALVVSWANLMPKYCSWFCWWRSQNPYRDETNTFQAILATNGSTSVVLFLYDDNGMNWYRRLGRKAMVGYATKTSGCKEYKGSFKESIFDIDDQEFKDPAGKSRRGVIVIVFSKGNEPPTPEEKCLSWIRNQPKDNEWIDEIPSCPCTWRAARSDSRFEYWFQNRQRICYAYIRGERTKTCCYFRTGWWTRGALITRARIAGRVARYSPVSNLDSYRKHDQEPFQLCCIDSNKYCNDFSQYRPVEDSCSNQAPQPCSCRWNFGFRRRRRRWTRVVRRRWWRRAPRRGWFFGDPHIATLDGFTYSFNGLGDYVMLTTPDKSHILHGKTVRPPYKDTNRLSNATVFSGFAMRNKKNTTVQVLFSDTMHGNLSIVVYNSTNVCQTFGIDALKKATGFILKKSNDTLIVLFEDSGFSVEITPGIGLLQISFSVPPELADKNTTGLLGKLNGNKTDDLTYPNGTAIPITSTDKEIFAFGQTWKVAGDDRMFVNETCSKQPVYFDSKFRPTFLSDYNRSAIDPNIITKCQNNNQCILDILLTGNEALGLATLDFEKKNDEKRAAMDNQPPDITVTPEVVNVTVGQTTNLTVTAEDPNEGDTYTLSDTGTLPAGAVFDNITGIFSWTPLTGQQNQDFKIEFAAVDKRGASQVKSVEVKFCDCKNGQECDFTNILRSNSNNSFELVGCNCSERYSGDHCETEDNPCADDPCYGNVTCTSKAAPEFGYKCGACPDGLVGNGEDCNDFDECADPANNTCTVNETCINTVGSYRCQCKPGYKVQTAGGKCTDFDECHPISGSNDCRANSVCTNNLGGYNCTCKEGYEGTPKEGCTDLDECLQDGRCNHNCENTVGSFKCKCNSGYKLNETSPGYYNCDDVDECQYPINNECEQICTNTPSSYLCSCRPGYKLDQNNKTCSVNESCSEGCADECVVVNGQNECKCFRGYKLSGNKTCQDINECATNTHGCAHNCINTKGNYSCSCRLGYKLMANKRDCEDIDECEKDKGGCEHKCTNTKGSRTCSCKRGYQLDNNKINCTDNDECKLRPACPVKGQICKNKKGGHKCRCPPRKFSDGKFACKKSKRFRLKIRLVKYISKVLVWKNELSDEFSEYYETIARLVVLNINKFFKTKSRSKKYYYGCKVTGFGPGSIVANVSVNYDPDSNVTINSVNQDIKGANEVGDYTSDPQSSSVSDVNECNDPEANDCHSNATCTNTEGSFSCKCKDGYEGDGVSCDVNECNDPEANNCHGDATCTNTKGSYSCSCKDGYEGDGVNCAKVKASKNNTALIVGLCVGISLLIIIIIIIILCCYKRNKKGDLHVTEEDNVHGMRPVQLNNPPRSGEVYYGDEKGRRGSNDSFEGQYDVAMATSNYYDNPVMKKDTETPM